MTAKKAAKRSSSGKKKAAYRIAGNQNEGRRQSAAITVIMPVPVDAALAGEKKKPVRNIQRHAAIETRKAFPEICTGLIEKAKAGAIGQTKMLMKISGLDAQPGGSKARRRGKTLSAMLLEELEKSRTIEGARAAEAAAIAEPQMNEAAG